MGGRQEIGMFIVAALLLALAAWPAGEAGPEPVVPCARQAELREASGETRLLCLDDSTTGAAGQALGQGSGACKLEDIPAGASVTLAADGSCQVTEGGMPGRLRLIAGEKLDLNRASTEDLGALPGIGPSLAERIVKTRQELGRFESVDDLLEVSGIGEKRLARLSPFFFVVPVAPGKPTPEVPGEN